MTKDELIRIAKEVGVEPLPYDGKWAVDELDAFAALVAAAQREACARICEGKVDHNEMGWTQACAIDSRSRENT